MIRIAAALLVALLVSGCFDEEIAEKPDPVTMTAEAVGYFCQMNVLEHEGPMAQIHLKGQPAPIWFTQIRDAVAYTRMPEETAEITAIYVSDMGRAANWANPGADNWVDADKAVFVIGSARTGGMGAPEAVPFGAQANAEAFVAENGGEIVSLADIPDDYVLSPVDTAAANFPEAGAQ